MDKSKAKKAVNKSKSRKKSADSDAAQQLAMAMQGGAAIDPEIQAAQIAMQPVDGYVNPYRAMGSMAPMQYYPGNMLGGNNFPVMVNPET
jgi:hypothetical protein